jgi:hypothetical protein
VSFERVIEILSDVDIVHSIDMQVMMHTATMDEKGCLQSHCMIVSSSNSTRRTPRIPRMQIVPADSIMTVSGKMQSIPH